MSRINGIGSVIHIFLILEENDEKKILMIKKSEKWQLPGGHVDQADNSLMALNQIMRLDLPYTVYAIGEFYGEYLDTEVEKLPDDVKVWGGEWKEGKITRGSQIEGTGWFTIDELASLTVSQIAREIIADLRSENLL
jgi:hypothetical protein